jgi:di/tricarboxylate transporter
MIEGFPPLPNAHALFALVTTAAALFMFTRKRIPLEISSLVLLALLALVFAVAPILVDGAPLSPMSFFEGFGHEALVTVCALMVMGQGLVQTGALEPLGRLLTRFWGVAPFLATLLTLVLGAVLSAFINNTPIVVLLLPILLSVAQRTGSSAGKILMPMGLATIVGGMATTIGTSTNLLVVSVAAEMGLPRIGMFDFLVPAALGGVIGIVYLWLVAPLLLPTRKTDDEQKSPRLFDARLHLNADSVAVGLSVEEAKQKVGDGIRLLRIQRGDHLIVPMPDVKLREGDRLQVRDTAKSIRAAADALKAALYSGDEEVNEEHPLKAENQTVAEIAIVNGSFLDGRNLRYTNFLERHQLAVLALHRAGRDIWKGQQEIMDVRLEQGDVLLVQGDKDKIHKLRKDPDFLLLDSSEEVARTDKATLALVVMVAAVTAAALGLVPIAVSSVVGAMLMLVLRCLNLDAAIRALSSSVIFIVVASLALGRALETTGASQYLTEVFLYLFQTASPAVIMSALMLLIAILTNIISNNAAAVIGTPIAVSIAQQLGVEPMPFVLAVVFGANLSFATPMSYKTNLLVMSAGNYSFNDFLKVGIPLTLLLWVAYSFILASLYL